MLVTKLRTIRRPHQVPILVPIEREIGDQEEVRRPVLLRFNSYSTRLVGDILSPPRIYRKTRYLHPTQLHRSCLLKELSDRPKTIARKHCVDRLPRQAQELPGAEHRRVIARHHVSSTKRFDTLSNLYATLHASRYQRKTDDIARLDKLLQRRFALDKLVPQFDFVVLLLGNSTDIEESQMRPYFRFFWPLKGLDIDADEPTPHGSFRLPDEHRSGDGILPVFLAKEVHAEGEDELLLRRNLHRVPACFAVRHFYARERAPVVPSHRCVKKHIAL